MQNYSFLQEFMVKNIMPSYIGIWQIYKAIEAER